MQPPPGPNIPAGAIVDLVTPFRNGHVDTDGLTRLVDWHIDSGIAGIVVCGKAGEATSLNSSERSAVLRTVLEKAAGRVPVLAGTGTNATASTIALTMEAKALGAIAAVIVTPYYNKPSQEGIFRHYEQIAAAVEIPIIVCNNPACTASDLAPRTLERLATIPSIVGIEDCTGDLARPAMMPQTLRSRFRLYSGDDVTAYAFNLAGGAGSISLAANLAPRYVAAMHDALATGNLDAAATLRGRLAAIQQAILQDQTPAAIKQALQHLHGLDSQVRLPLTPVAPDIAAALRMALAGVPQGDKRKSA